MNNKQNRPAENPAKEQPAQQTAERNPAKQQTVKRLLSYAGKSRSLLSLSLVLSGLSALIGFVPYIMVFFVMRDVISSVAANEAVNAAALVGYGLWAVGSAATGFVLYYAALMLSHATAFTIQENLSIRMTETLAELPIGWHITHVSGKVRKVFEKNVNQLETLIAHSLPDTAQNTVSPFAILVLMLAFDWRLGGLCIFPLLLAYAIMYVFMTGKDLKVKMGEYQQALDAMSNEAVEYVRGIPVVKTFGQTVFSFKRFKRRIIFGAKKRKKFFHRTRFIVLYDEHKRSFEAFIF